MCETRDLYVQDLPTDIRQPYLGEVPIMQSFEDIQKYYAPIRIDCSQGWDVTPAGEACWRLVGFHVTVGIVVTTVKVLDKNGQYIRKKWVNFHHPGAPANLAGDGPHLYFETGLSPETKWEGNGAQQALYGSNVAPDQAGSFSVWVNIDPGQIGPSHEWITGGGSDNAPKYPRYSDAVHGIGLRVNTNHLIVNPIFQWVVKPLDGQTEPDEETDTGEGVETDPDSGESTPALDYLSIVVAGQEIGRVNLG